MRSMRNPTSPTAMRPNTPASAAMCTWLNGEVACPGRTSSITPPTSAPRQFPLAGVHYVLSLCQHCRTIRTSSNLAPDGRVHAPPVLSLPIVQSTHHLLMQVKDNVCLHLCMAPDCPCHAGLENVIGRTCHPFPNGRTTKVSARHVVPGASQRR